MLGAADTDLPSTPPTLVDNRLISRIHRDLNSPSASVRVRALKAIHNPSKSAYAQFDVPHAEQSLITAEERNPPPPKSIEELMRDIIVYVEVRTGEDNRSTGVKKVISALGAKVNDKLLRDTTHVIFKDGLLSTYKKAKNWNIPVVSILWIEACKTQRRICDPNDFPISNVDRYENPELYEKMKRHKSMQPDSEANKRVRAKANNSTPKNATPRNGALTRTSTFSADTPTSAINTKNDISRFFTQLSSSKSTPIGCAKRILGDTPATPINGTQRFVADFPTMQASEKLDLNDNTLTEQYGKDLPSTQSDEALPSSGEIPLTNEARKLVDSIAAIQERTPRNTTRASIRRRSTMRIDASIEATTNCVEEMSWEQTQPSTPATRTRRRSSIHLACNMKFSKEKESFDSAKKNQHIENVITEEAEEESTETVTAVTPAARSTRKRKTTYTPKPLELTGESRDSTIKTTTTNSELQQEQESVKKRSTIRRRTLFTSHKYAESPPPEKPSSDAKQQQQLNFTPKLQPNVEKMHSDDQTLTPLSTVGLSEDNLMQTTPQQTGSLLEQHAAANIFSSTRAPGRRRTLFDVSMDIITQRLQNINRSARRSTARPIDSDLERLSQSPIPTESISTLLKSAGKQNRDQESHSGQEAQQTAAAGDAGCSATTATSDASSESSAPAPKKKRKLFVPNECLLTPPSVSSLSSSSLINAGSKTAPNARRRRTLMPLVQPQVEPKIETTPITSSNKSSAMQPRTRRSTMDFEDIRNSKSALSKLVKEATNDKKTTTAAKVAAEPNKEKLKMKRDDNAVTAPLITLEKQKPEGPFLVYTNMRKEQVEVIKEVGTSR